MRSWWLNSLSDRTTYLQEVYEEARKIMLPIYYSMASNNSESYEEFVDKRI